MKNGISKRQIFSLRNFCGKSLIAYDIIAEDDNSYVLRDTSCRHYPACEIVVDKKTMKFVEMSNEDKLDRKDVYADNHKDSLYFKTESEARVAFYDASIEIYNQQREDYAARLDIARQMLDAVGKKRRVEYDFDFKHYATRMFVIKNSDVVNEIIKKIIYNDGSEMMTLKDIKNRLIDNIIELSINKIVETKIQFNGNTSHTTEYYVDDRRDEDDLNQKAIYMRIFRQSRDKQIRFERMSYSEYDYEGDVDTREYCKDIRSDDNFVFGTRANAVNFLLNKVIAELERRIKDFTYNVTRYENNITETMGKRNAWITIDNTDNK